MSYFICTVWRQSGWGEATTRLQLPLWFHVSSTSMLKGALAMHGEVVQLPGFLSAEQVNSQVPQWRALPSHIPPLACTSSRPRACVIHSLTSHCNAPDCWAEAPILGGGACRGVAQRDAGGVCHPGQPTHHCVHCERSNRQPDTRLHGGGWQPCHLWRPCWYVPFKAGFEQGPSQCCLAWVNDGVQDLAGTFGSCDLCLATSDACSTVHV